MCQKSPEPAQAGQSLTRQDKILPRSVKFQGPPLIIPVFIPHSGCPHQCAFCNQSVISGQKCRIPDRNDIKKIIAHYYQYKGSRRSVELAFFGGNFLGLSPDTITGLLSEVTPYIHAGEIDGIRFSTRPDTISEDTMELIREFRISAVELGVQSMNDEVLNLSRRGHSSQDTINAANLLKEYSIRTGIQVMAGLPGDDEKTLLESTVKAAELFPDFARIYPLVVLKGSRLEKTFKSGLYKPLNLQEAVRLVKKMYRIFNKFNIDVIRMGLQTSDLMEDCSEVIAGPWHPAFGHLVYCELFFDAVCEKLNRSPDLLNEKKICLTVHPASESRVRGDKNGNLKKLSRRYPGIDFCIRTDASLKDREVFFISACQPLQ